MADITLHSNAVQLKVDSDLASHLIDAETPQILRASPGIRGSDLSELASCLYIASSAGANLATLILAKDQVQAFVERLLPAIQRTGRNSIELSANINGTKASVRITTTDSEGAVTRAVCALIQALDSGTDDPGHPAG